MKTFNYSNLFYESSWETIELSMLDPLYKYDDPDCMKCWQGQKMWDINFKKKFLLKFERVHNLSWDGSTIASWMQIYPYASL